MLGGWVVYSNLSPRAVFTFREIRKGPQTLFGSRDLADAGELHRYLAG